MATDYNLTGALKHSAMVTMFLTGGKISFFFRVFHPGMHVNVEMIFRWIEYSWIHLFYKSTKSALLKCQCTSVVDKACIRQLYS